MLAEKNETIKKSIVTLKELTADEQAKMQMEARERYRRDMVAAQDFVWEQSEEKIRELEDNLQQSHVENEKLQKEKDAIQKEKNEIRKEKDAIQKENAEMSERIRFLEEQLAKTNQV